MSSRDFDIEHFPTSETALRMMSRISPIYERAYVGKWIFQVMGLDMDVVRLRFDELAAQAFPETATWGLFYWEMRYGLPIREGQDIYKRRQEILSRRAAGAPLNPKRVEAILSALTGREVKVTEDVAPYTFAVEVMPGDTSFDYAEVVRRIKRIKPSHQAFAFQLTFQAPVIRTGAYTETGLVVEVWPDIVTGVELPDAHIRTGAAPELRLGVEVWPSNVECVETIAQVKASAAAQVDTRAEAWPATVEAVEATAKTGTAAGAQHETVTRIWPGAVEHVETKAGAAGVAVEIHQTIEIWP